MPETVFVKMNQTWALPSRKLGLEGRTDIDGKRHRNLLCVGGLTWSGKNFQRRGRWCWFLEEH